MNEFLEAGNGSWSILASYCVIFTVVYLVRGRPRGRMPLYVWMWSIGIELAIVTAGICTAVALSRAPVWLWRFNTGGDLDQFSAYRPMVTVGFLVAYIFFLWYLRIITRWVGIWPVVLAALTVLVYLTTFLF